MADLDNPPTETIEYDDDDEFLYGSTLASANEQIANEKNSYSFPKSEQKSARDKDGNDLYDPSHPTSDDKVEDDDLYDIYGEATVEQSNSALQLSKYDEDPSLLLDPLDDNSIIDQDMGDDDIEKEAELILEQSHQKLPPQQRQDSYTSETVNGEEGDHSLVGNLNKDMAEMNINIFPSTQQEQEGRHQEHERLITEDKIIMEAQPGKSHDNNGGRRVVGLQSSTTSRNPAVDINAVGQIEGVNLYDVDLDSFEDKPWRKPGADITDYFNFGFNEHTWRSYCAKQKQIRRRGRDHDDSVIQVVSSEREAVLEELEPIPPPQIVDGRQNDDYGMQDTGYPQDFPGPPMGVHMFGAPEMGGPIGGPIGAPPFFMGNPEMPPTGPMGYDPSFRGGQPMRQMMRSGGMPGMPSRIPPGMPNAMSGGIPGGMPGRIPPGMPSGMAGAMMSRGRGIPMEDRSYFSMDEPSSWDMDNRNQSQYRPNFPDAPFAHRMRPSSLHRPGGGSGRDTSVDSRISDRAGGEDERDRIERSGGNDRLYSVYDNRDREDSRGYPSRALREEDRWDVSRKRSGSSVPRDDDEFRTKRRH
ncbi:4514_t:CDS:10 [Ambispora gerdemannii]|uniref:4514_t:CDS:1 n=1 Tax=Ambispora gerdemannii TaxID=144530 RepID=A0A9N8ZUX9_9GLOM|nr:4514_t:CDS:10 [Ambispora gerdemannii]